MSLLNPTPLYDKSPEETMDTEDKPKYNKGDLP